MATEGEIGAGLIQAVLEQSAKIEIEFRDQEAGDHFTGSLVYSK
jgi:hypothetical protein